MFRFCVKQEKHVMIKIRNKIGLAIAILSLIISSLVGVISLWRFKKIVSAEAESNLLHMVDAYGLDFELELQKVYQTSYALEALLKGTVPGLLLPGPQHKMAAFKLKTVPVVEQLLIAQKPVTAWIIFNPGLVKGEHTISYEDIDGNGNYLREPEYCVADFDASDQSMKWWYDAVKKGEVWTKPYYWENWKTELISYSKAVFVHDTLIACVGSDFDFKKLRQKLTNANIYQHGFMFLLDNDLDFIIHPTDEGKNLSQVIDTLTYNKICDQFASEKQGKLYYKIDGQDKILAFHKLSNGWYLGVAVELKDIFAGTALIFRTILIIILVGMVLSVLIGFILSSTITRPLNRLISKFREGAQGQLTVRAEKSNTTEINELSDHFNSFMTSMQSMVEQLKESENNLLVAKHKAEESDKLKTAFLENISHEVRTPLNVILGFTQVFVKEDLETETKQDYLKFIHSSSERLIKIVEDIMFFSELEKGVLQLHCKPIDIDWLLSEIFCEFIEKNHIAEKQIKLNIVKPESNQIRYITSDVLFLKRAFQYLIENAWKFTNEGAIEFGYQFDANKQPVFFVKDTGVGIPLHEQEKVFKKFYKYQHYKDKFYDGSGLGLSITQDLVKLLGGRLWMKSEVNRGTEVYFTIKEAGHE